MLFNRYDGPLPWAPKTDLHACNARMRMGCMRVTSPTTHTHAQELWSSHGVGLSLLLAAPVLLLDAATLLPKYHAPGNTHSSGANADTATEQRGQPQAGQQQQNQDQKQCMRALKADLKLGTTDSGGRAMCTLYQMVAAGPVPPR